MLVIPIKGIDRVFQKSPTTLHIYSSEGIGSFNIHLPTRDSIHIDFFYAENKLYDSLEGLKVIDDSNGLDIGQKLFASGKISINKGRVFIQRSDVPVKWRFLFIDYYRG